MLTARPSIFRTGVTSGVAALLLVAVAAASKKTPVISRAEAATIWVGISLDETSLIRLSLRGDGTAVFARSLIEQQPERVEFASWDLQGEMLSLARPTGATAKLTLVEGRFSGDHLTLTIRGSGWSQSFRMRREDWLMERWTQVAEIDLVGEPH